jgi:hypothetical protein
VKELHSETALLCSWKGALLKQQHLLNFRSNTKHLQQKDGKEPTVERVLDDSTCPGKKREQYKLCRK